MTYSYEYRDFVMGGYLFSSGLTTAENYAQQLQKSPAGKLFVFKGVTERSSVRPPTNVIQVGFTAAGEKYKKDQEAINDIIGMATDATARYAYNAAIGYCAVEIDKENGLKINPSQDDVSMVIKKREAIDQKPHMKELKYASYAKIRSFACLWGGDITPDKVEEITTAQKELTKKGLTTSVDVRSMCGECEREILSDMRFIEASFPYRYSARWYRDKGEEKASVMISLIAFKNEVEALNLENHIREVDKRISPRLFQE